MLSDIGCNLLESFNQIYERTGEYNPNSIFEARKPKSDATGVPAISAGDIGDMFGPDTSDGKENRTKLAKLVYGDGSPFTIKSGGDIPWTIVLNDDGDVVVSFDENSHTVTINAKRAAYKKSVAKFLTEGLKNRKYTNIHKTQKSTFQDAINQLVDFVKKAIDGQDMSVTALDKAAQDRKNKAKATREQNKQADTTEQSTPDNQQTTNNEPAQETEPSNFDEPKTQQQMYKDFVAKFKEDYTDRIPADCNDPQMTESDIDDKARDYFNAIQSPILDEADDDTRNAAYRYVVSAITKHVRSLNGNQQPNQQQGESEDGKDDFNWGGDDDDDLNKKNEPSGESGKKKGGLMGYVQRQANTAEKFKNTFAY